MDFGPSFIDSFSSNNEVENWRTRQRGRVSQRASVVLQRVTELKSGYWQWRLAPLVCVVGVLLLGLAGRLWQLQAVQGDLGRQASRNNSLTIERLPAARGVIYDRNGQILARNEPSFRVVVTYARLPQDDGELSALSSKLADSLGVSKKKVDEKLQQAAERPFEPMTVQSHIDRDTEIALLTKLQDLPGVSIEQDYQRYYPMAEVMSHVLGYTGSISQKELEDPLMTNYYPGQEVGKSGIEKEYEKELHGIAGKKFSQVDAYGLPQQVSTEEAPQDGQGLRLSIDSKLQQYVFTRMRQAMKEFGSRGASAVIQNPKTGEVLALVSLPSYDGNLFAGGIKQQDYQRLINRADNPMFDRVIAGTYPPGSTVKPLIGGAAVLEKVISPSTLIYSPNVIKVGGTDFADWTYWIGRSGPGNINVITAIAQSTDTFFYKIGGGFEGMRGLGVDAMYQYYTSAGFGSKTGIDLPGEARGVVPNPAWKRSQFPYEPTWFVGNSYHMAIGQGYLLATPLQVNVMTSAIANGGRMMKPYLGMAIIDPVTKSEKVMSSEVLNSKVIGGEGLKIAQEGFRASVDKGIVYPLRENPWKVAAKTGTAEYGVRGDEDGYGSHAWVTGYAPYDKPELSFTIMLENGATSTNAAEIADDILRWMAKE